jgi:hypothetical protein
MEGNPNTCTKTVQAIKSAAHAATVTPSTGIDCRGWDELLIVINAGTCVGAGSATVTIQESSASDGTGDAFATIGTFTAITTANDDAIHVGRIKLSQRNRYIRAVLTYAGNGSTEVTPIGIAFVLMGPRDTALATDTFVVNTDN